MDWSKAKTILIIALLVTCLVLGGMLLYDKTEEKKTDKKAAAAVEIYLKEQGVSSICDIPSERPSLPVLFVQFFGKSDSEGHKQLTEYKGREFICICEAEQSPFFPELKEAGKTKAKVCTASSALMSACSELESLKGLKVEEIKLVYYIQLTEISEDLEDTALPNWMIKTNMGTYFVNAFAQ